jgi:hypothetical protein
MFMNFIRRFLVVLSTGYIFFYFSERVFWSFWRTEEILQGSAEPDGFGTVFGGLIIYSIAAYVTLILIERYRVRSLAALFIAAGVFGWLIEGVYAMTFFGGGGIPLPFSISWTALASHAIISVMIGWYYLGISLREKSYLHTIAFSLLIGLYWGVWAVAWALETPPLITEPWAFFVEGMLFTLMFAFSHWLLSVSRPGAFTSTKWEWGILGAIVLAWTGFVTVPATNIFFPILAAMFIISCLLLRRNAKTETGEHALHVFEKKVPLLKLLCLFLIPLVGAVVYGVLNGAGLIFPSNFIVMLISTALGFVFFIWAGVVVYRRK